MIVSGIFQSVEFYVLAVLVAAVTVALLSRSPGAGPVRQVLLPGVITREDGAEASVPSVEFICADDGTVVLRRRGVMGVTASGAVSLAIEIKGFDVAIRERSVKGRRDDEAVDTAAFILDFMGPERYFISYTSELTEADSMRFISLTLHNRPGNRVKKPLI